MGILIAFFIVVASLVGIATAMIKQSRLTKIRMGMFRQIGTEWAKNINETTGSTTIVINPLKEIRERMVNRDKTWIISLPVVMGNTPHPPFDMLLAIDFIKSDKPQVRTILSGLVITTSPDFWWAPEHNSPVLPDIVERFKKRGLIFNVASPSS